MKSFLAAVFAITVGLGVSGCASSTPAAGSNNNNAASSSASSGSGVTVFGTLDAGVSNYKNR